jgi:uncharacterized protein
LYAQSSTERGPGQLRKWHVLIAVSRRLNHRLASLTIIPNNAVRGLSPILGTAPFWSCNVPTLLNANEVRVIGCLLEKAATTPDQYPLSLNALTNACNQKSNREPVLELDERAVQETVDALLRKHLVLERSGFGSRVPKYQQRFCNTGFGSLEFNPLQTAILCELMLRGAQTPGELRSRVGRMCELPDPSRVEVELEALTTRNDGPFIVKLTREPGRRDARYAHLLSGDVGDVTATSDAEAPAAQAAEPRTASQADRIARLERLVEELRHELEQLKLQRNGQ